MKHNEQFTIHIIQGYNEYSGKQEVKYRVKKVLTREDKWNGIKEIIFSAGAALLISNFRELALSKYDLHMVEMLYDKREIAEKHIKNYNEGLYDNPFY